MTDFAAIFVEATFAAAEAVEAEVAREPENPHAFDCGFAWVVVRPANHPFVNWCKAQIKAAGGPQARDARQFGDKNWNGGWCFWKPGNFNGQSIRIHEVGARAFANVLKNHNINAETGSRYD